MADDPSASSSGAQDDLTGKPGQDTSDAGSDQKPDASDSDKSKTEQRFQELLTERAKLREIADWYRENIGDPEDVLKFREWKAEQKNGKGKQDDDDPFTDIPREKWEQVRRVIAKADPELEQLKRDYREEKQAREQAQWDDAEDAVRDAATKRGVDAKDEETISWIAQNTMLVIRGDERLSRQWKAGNLSCVSKAVEKVFDRLKSASKLASREPSLDDIRLKRRVSKLPTAPPGRSSVVPAAQTNKSQGGGFNNKELHARAWDRVEASHEE